MVLRGAHASVVDQDHLQTLLHLRENRVIKDFLDDVATVDLLHFVSDPLSPVEEDIKPDEELNEGEDGGQAEQELIGVENLGKKYLQ